MVYKIADNIISPIGMTTAENLQALKAGVSALCLHVGKWGLPEPFTASLFSDSQQAAFLKPGMSRFASLVTTSVTKALETADFDWKGDDVILIISTTKGNVEGMQGLTGNDAEVSLADSANAVARALEFKNSPVTVCNACISGVSAIALAYRLLQSGLYRYAVVCGADVLNTFVVSGFQSLKAMSVGSCRPFDMERTGLNLGEAAATMVLSTQPTEAANSDHCWRIEAVAVRNDAFHLSTPSKNAEGAYRTLKKVLEGRNIEDLALVNVHGTATMFNDQMESVAVERAGLSQIPANALKGFYGHTLGAAGVLETVINMAALDEGLILPTRGFDELGVSGKINIAASASHSEKKAFVKMISGFGGGNAAIWADKKADRVQMPLCKPFLLEKTHHVHITPQEVVLDGATLEVMEQGKQMLTGLYKGKVNDYPKFYKMDMLSRLGFLASELLRQAERTESESVIPNDERAVILFNHHASIDADRNYLKSIADPQDFFPSPSVFVYTLPNIVTGEIAIRHHYHGETALYVLDGKNQKLMEAILNATMEQDCITSAVTGWLDFEDEAHFEADMYVVCRKSNTSDGE